MLCVYSVCGCLRVFARGCHGVYVTYMMVGGRWLGEIEIARENLAVSARWAAPED